MHNPLRSLLVASGSIFGLPMENWIFDLFCSFFQCHPLLQVESGHLGLVNSKLATIYHSTLICVESYVMSFDCYAWL